jgi:hypothetical protein
VRSEHTSGADYFIVRSIPIELSHNDTYLAHTLIYEVLCMSFALYLIGLVLLLGGIGWALVTAGIAQIYIGIALLIVAGIGVMMAVSRTRAKDPPAG